MPISIKDLLFRPTTFADAPKGPTLLQFVTSHAGTWTSKLRPDESHVLRLEDDDDEVTLAGPVDLSVAVEAANAFQSLGNPQGQGPLQYRELWNYEVTVPAGHSWTYDVRQLAGYRVGANRGCRVVIRRRTPRPVPPTQAAGDLPCAFAVENLAGTDRFFPSACEPCGDRPVRPPAPDCGPRLDVPIAAGGCVRPRYFNGMSIAREDLETELRYLRLKLRMHNRAAGAGVVWGLDVALRGSSVVVGPGYGVDCCGNDLTVTCDYAVSAEVLLRDPAVCRAIRQGEDCFALLLEYVECVQEPRPVHAGGCAPQAAACEYSRVRETVRLRLVPPRAPPGNPIADFFEAIRAITPDGKAPAAAPPAAAPGAETWRAAPANTAIPWRVDVTNPNDSRLLSPLDSADAAGTLRVEKPGGENVRFRVTLGAGTQAVAGSISSGPATGPLDQVFVVAPDPTLGPATVTIAWETRSAAAHLRGTTNAIVTPRSTPEVEGIVRDTTQGEAYIFFPNGFQPPVGAELLVRDGTGNTVGRVRVTGFVGQTVAAITSGNVAPNMRAVLPGKAFLDVRIPPTAVQIAVAVTTPAPHPCCGASCCEPGPHPDLAANLRLLVLALLYGRLVQGAAPERGGVAAAALARIAARLGIERARLGDFEQATVALYQAWCAGGLYDGPHCRTEPDGVVIGCARIRGGDICDVDPFGGRRFVVHQPLVDHWAAQFGIPPFDRTVGRLFARLCCLSHLAGFGELVPDASRRLPRFDPATLGLSPALLAATAVHGFSSGGTAAVAQAPPAADVSSMWMRMLAEVPELELSRLPGVVDRLLCGDAGEEVVPPREAAERPRTNDVVIRTTNALALDRRPRPLLRQTARELTASVLARAPLSDAVADDSRLFELLTKADVKTLVDLIEREPEDVLRIAKDVDPREIDETFRKAEELAAAAAVAVSEATRAVGAHGLASRADLEDPKVAARLAKSVRAKLTAKKVHVDTKSVSDAVKALRD